ncbi:MAG: hypothetical protein DDT21_00691 [Syntrophomonadaceae bacterium]|nr:hypothetical protein [Bacillota bacterium]
MHGYFLLPYFYRSGTRDFFLHLTGQDELIFTHRRQREVWEQEKVIAAGCRRFQAAPDREGLLHIIAADTNNQLGYLLTNGESIHKAAFNVTNSELPFFLAFSAGGNSSFYGGQTGRLLHGNSCASSGWVVNVVSTVSEATFPTGLVMDRHGGSHLLLYDQVNQALLYQYSGQAQKAGSPLPLARAIRSGALSVIWLDASQTVHVAWHDTEADFIGYCRKKAGGWPGGGWLPLKLLPVDFTPKYLSFFEQDQAVHLWVADESGRLQVCSTPDGQLQSAGKDISAWHPLRIGGLGVNTLNLAAALPPESWCFPLETADDVNPARESAADEQGSLLLLHARQLMEGRKVLESRLQQKEASLLQLRQLLERAQESHTKQRQKWQEQIRLLEGTVQKLGERSKSEAGELTLLKTQYEQLQNKLTQTETEKRKLQAEVFSLRSKLGETQIVASMLREKVKELESELESRKSVWEKFAGLLHKKPDTKN